MSRQPLILFVREAKPPNRKCPGSTTSFMPVPSITVRPMSPHESEPVAQITRACPQAAQWRAEDYAPLVLPDAGKQANAEWTGKGNCVLVAVTGSAIAGFVAIRGVADELEIAG